MKGDKGFPVAPSPPFCFPPKCKREDREQHVEIIIIRGPTAESGFSLIPSRAYTNIFLEGKITFLPSFLSLPSPHPPLHVRHLANKHCVGEFKGVQRTFRSLHQYKGYYSKIDLVNQMVPSSEFLSISKFLKQIQEFKRRTLDSRKQERSAESREPEILL